MVICGPERDTTLKKNPTGRQKPLHRPLPATTLTAGPSDCLKTYPFYYKPKTRHFYESVNLLITKVKIYSLPLQPALIGLIFTGKNGY